MQLVGLDEFLSFKMRIKRGYALFHIMEGGGSMGHHSIKICCDFEFKSCFFKRLHHACGFTILIVELNLNDLIKLFNKFKKKSVTNYI